MSETLANLLKNPPKEEEKKDNKEEMKLMALMLANKAISLAGQEGSFLKEDGTPDFSKAIPTIPWIT